MGKLVNKGAVGATGVGAGVGAALGGSVGIAGAFGAISGALPLAALGGYLGYKIYRAVSKTSAAREFYSGVKAGYSEKAQQLQARRAELEDHSKTNQ